MSERGSGRVASPTGSCRSGDAATASSSLRDGNPSRSAARLPTKFYCAYCKNRRRYPTDLWAKTSAYWEPCDDCCDADGWAFWRATPAEQLAWFVTGPGAAYAPLKP